MKVKVTHGDGTHKKSISAFKNGEGDTIEIFEGMDGFIFVNEWSQLDLMYGDETIMVENVRLIEVE